MKFLLVSANFCRNPLPVYPLGMGVVAKVLHDAGHEVSQFDPLPYGQDGFQKPLEEAYRAFMPDAIGISIRNIDVTDSNAANGQYFNSILKVISACQALGDCPVSLGGAGFSMNPEAVLAATGADYGVAGEGESAILDFANDLQNATLPPKGTIYRCPGKTISGARYSTKIAEFYVRETHTIPIQTKRGCPFHCIYCTYPTLEGHRLRARDIDQVLEDIAFVKENFPDEMIYFTDSIFNDPKHHYKSLLQRMIDLDLAMPWTGFITPYNLTPEDIDIMAESGLACADLGVDGSTDETLRGLGKNFTFQQVRECCRRFEELHIGVNANAMFGGPGETWDTVDRGILNLKELGSAYVIIFSGIRLLSGAPLFTIARQENAIPEDWDDTTPLYYYAPGIDPNILHEKLLQAFSNSNHCIYPPDSRNDDYRLLHKYGYAKIRKLKLGATTKRRK